jgi:GxxExxY protein
MHENEIATIVVDAAYQVHTTLGPGLLESIYERALEYELVGRGLRIATQVHVPAEYKGKPLGLSFRADMLVEDKVVLELKSVEYSAVVHKKQLLSYLRLMDKRLGLLINFGSPTIKNGVTRIVNGLQENQ